MRILAVDDEPIFLSLIEQNLIAIGIEDVQTVGSAHMALGVLSTSPDVFDCFLLDIQMEEMDGIELCRRIRAMPVYKNTPILMVTAMSEKRYIDDAFRAGASDYITKPIDPVEIKVRIGMVRKILAERQHARALAGVIGEFEKNKGANCSFDMPIALDGARNLIQYDALENYLLKLGNARLFTSVAIGFHVENADIIHSLSTGMQFIDAMTDVAEVIGDCLKVRTHMVAYVGSGEFVAVLPRYPGINSSELASAINASMREYSEFYQNTGTVLPTIRVGAPATTSLFSFADPTRILRSAVNKARWTGRPQKLEA